MEHENEEVFIKLKKAEKNFKRRMLMIDIIFFIGICLFLSIIILFIIFNSNHCQAKTVNTFVTVAQNEDKIMQMHTRVLENNCNSCIKLCEGRKRCKETCFTHFCNKK